MVVPCGSEASSWLTPSRSCRGDGFEMYDKEQPFIYGDINRRQIPLDDYLYILSVSALMLLATIMNSPAPMAFEPSKYLLYTLTAKDYQDHEYTAHGHQSCATQQQIPSSPTVQ